MPCVDDEGNGNGPVEPEENPWDMAGTADTDKGDCGDVGEVKPTLRARGDGLK